MLMALILAVGVIVTATAPVEPIDDWTVLQPEQQQEELTADGKERSARSLGFGVGLIGVGAGVSPFVGYPCMYIVFILTKLFIDSILFNFCLQPMDTVVVIRMVIMDQDIHRITDAAAVMLDILADTTSRLCTLCN